MQLKVVKLMLPLLLGIGVLVVRAASEQTTQDTAESREFASFPWFSLWSGIVQLARSTPHEVAINTLTGQVDVSGPRHP